MRTSRVAIAVAAAIMLSGCATIVDGTTQTVAIRTAPTGATCTVLRGGQTLGVVQSTPADILVDRSSRDLTVFCDKPGWQPTVFGIASRFTGVTAGNALIGGFPGIVTDALTGADYRYDETGRIVFMSPVVGPDRLVSAAP